MTQPMAQKTDPSGGTGGAPQAAPAAVPKEITCPICATVFDPRATTGRCPVCSEEVVPAALTTRVVPGLTPTWAWLKAGGWRVILVALMVIYEVALLIVVWQRFAAAHAF